MAAAVAAAALVTTTAPPTAHAAPDGPPPDVIASQHDPAANGLPDPPEGFVQETVGEVRWAYPRSAASQVQPLQQALPETWREVTRDLGAQRVSEALTVRIARGPKDMVALSPTGLAPPSYAVGVAYPGHGVIVISLVDPGSWLPPDLPSVLTHELSHIALYRAAGGHHVPRWFAEGLAVYQAGEQNLARIRTLAEAAVSGQVLPIDQLSSRFPERTREVNLAYAQSADLVRHLLSSYDDKARLQRTLRKVAEGASFDAAFEEEFHVKLAYLEREWRSSLDERFRITPMVLTGGTLWVVLALVLVWAFVKRRRDHRRKLATWEKEEAAHDRAVAALELERRLEEAQEKAGQETRAWLADLPAHTPEKGVPTVEHDGQQHTLH